MNSRPKGIFNYKFRLFSVNLVENVQPILMLTKSKQGSDKMTIFISKIKKTINQTNFLYLSIPSLFKGKGKL